MPLWTLSTFPTIQFCFWLSGLCWFNLFQFPEGTPKGSIATFASTFWKLFALLGAPVYQLRGLSSAAWQPHEEEVGVWLWGCIYSLVKCSSVLGQEGNWRSMLGVVNFEWWVAIPFEGSLLSSNPSMPFWAKVLSHSYVYMWNLGAVDINFFSVVLGYGKQKTNGILS